MEEINEGAVSPIQSIQSTISPSSSIIRNEDEKKARRVTYVTPEMTIHFKEPTQAVQSYYESNMPIEDLEKQTINGRWIDNQKAKNFFCSLMSLLYALVITVVAVIIEISPTFKKWLQLGETAFHAWMYGFGTLFLLYCYVFMLYPGWFRYVQKMLYRFGITREDEGWVIEKTSHTAQGAGSLYLRLGAVVFGMVGIVLMGIELFLLIRDHNCNNSIFQYSLMILFIFVQMHFIFCNSKMAIRTSQSLCKFGMMHNVSVNIFTWLKFVLVKAVSKHKKKAQSHKDSDSSEEIHRGKKISDGLVEAMTTILFEMTETTTEVMPTTDSLKIGGSLHADEFLDGITTFLATCIVEYSLIGAAVMFIMWMSIDSNHQSTSTTQRAKRKSRMRIDCSRSSKGLFGGIIFMIFAFVSIGMYTVYDKLEQPKNSILCFGIIDLIMFVWVFVVCVHGIWKMRVLQYRKDHNHHNAEILDEILLVIGLFGEIVYCCIAIELWLTTRKEKPKMPTYDLPVYISRLLAVFMQSVFIFISSRLVARGPEEIRLKPGKQTVTFLLLANVTLFFFHTYESMKSTLPINASSPAFPYIIYGVSPLVVFYRFHSSVCLVDIFKRTYNTKGSDGTSSASMATTASTGMSSIDH